jgi:hypothetical protein
MMVPMRRPPEMPRPPLEVLLRLGWTPGFFDGLTPLDAPVARELDAMMTAVHTARSSKCPPRL